MKEKKIYVLLSDTGTWFTRMIRMYTKAELNHASIAFDPELKEVYSFGRKNPGNPFIGGFVKEDLSGELFKTATCAIYSCTVSERRYRKIRAYVQGFDEQRNRYRYNLIGLIAIMFNIKFKRENAFFCSQFVASVFEYGGSPLVAKCASLTTPSDLEKSAALQLMFRGALSEFVTAHGAAKGEKAYTATYAAGSEGRASGCLEAI
ncbi:hypothetical protein IDH44_03695 [Paenibacillus sp. IB182496]|uniref:Permuted papain-like amidase YaeF/Yiix C92 family enzyme n=1 Tax=Paenibacillus sabuli TaxID=2772509 RepID=A0A927BQW9_9BACL|nr:hypothetical protein [Paenibacillus sabuli]MBD2844281.1 hypothetical protein [Paenibacillus sabuli]